MKIIPAVAVELCFKEQQTTGPNYSDTHYAGLLLANICIAAVYNIPTTIDNIR